MLNLNQTKEKKKKKDKEDITALDINGRLIQNQQTLADVFNNYFLNIAEKLRESYCIDEMTLTQKEATIGKALRNREQQYPSMQFKCTTAMEIEKIIKSLKTTNAQGYDEISAKVLKWSAPFISSPLPYICNRYLETGIIPARLKYSTVIPIYKTGERLNINNYRPISILISFSKILEKIIAKRIQEHITR